jgi:hypothetical protein
MADRLVWSTSVWREHTGEEEDAGDEGEQLRGGHFIVPSV